MKATVPRPIFLKDYSPPSHLINTIDLCFDLEDEKTRVTSKMSLVQNPAAGNSPQPLVLDGRQLELISIRLDGKPLEPSEYTLTDHSLDLGILPKAFSLEIETLINPKANTALEGLYKSGSIFCTQNEPEGFRHITYFLDRSDVMSKYTTKIIADKKLYPVLLANGNCIGQGDLPNGRHWTVWEDPFLKPCYLFALVAGDLGSISDTFITRSKRTIDLRIYCDKGKESRCEHGMRSLKKSMQWDEEVFGLEYDLDIFMIVAVDAFNFGAMENKGLNIFNTNCVLADVKSATDINYARVEKVIAHEYFHNWTGNRVTCRDWFQLTLKEGLTVFRDQEFSADMNSRPVERIDDVRALRSKQFDEDAGPTAHPIQPQSYIQINNFYTATVYEKGAEVIRMIQSLIGKKAFRQGIDKYFELYDGQAVTTNDFLHAMEVASGRDLSQFARWYHQAGTPDVTVSFAYDSDKKAFSLTVEQSCAPTADNSPKEPFHFPLRVGLLDKSGNDIRLSRPDVLEVTKHIETFVFDHIPEAPIPSINRYFSAPVRIHTPYTHQDLMFLMAHDSDEFNRWEAGQELGCQLMLHMLAQLDDGDEFDVDPGYIDAYGVLLSDHKLDQALKAMALIPPTEDALGQRQNIIDFDGNHVIREYTCQQLAKAHQDKFWSLYQQLNTKESYEFEQKAVGRRALKNACLFMLSYTGESDIIKQCAKQYHDADNMTDRFAALKILADLDHPERQEVLDAFYKEWKGDNLVMTKWFAVQAQTKLDDALKTVQQLEKDPIFHFTIPNLVRALHGTFIHNNIHFNANNGEGYAYLADTIIKLDKINPQVSAGLAGGFKKFGKMDVLRKKAMQAELDRILAVPKLSQNVFEIVSKCRA